MEALENPEERTIPDGSTNPMTENDLIMIRKYRPDLDEKLLYQASLPEIAEAPSPPPKVSVIETRKKNNKKTNRRY